jgi:hypothetical protein
MLRRTERKMGLGSLSTVCLADARAKAAECRSLRQAGVDPIDRRKKQGIKQGLMQRRL